MPDSKDLLSNFNTIVRVFGSGGVALLILLYLDNGDATHIRCLLQTQRGPWFVSIGAALAAMCSFGLYVGLLEDVFLGLVFLVLRRCFRNETNDIIPDTTAIFRGDVSRHMYRERKARYCAGDPRVRELQCRMDTMYAWLMFLYCTSILVLAEVVALANANAVRRGGLIAVSAWLVAFVADLRISRSEIWLIKHYPQWPTNAAPSPLPSPGVGTGPAAPVGRDGH
jgi:hypothetical protein